jgi:hypothetical protein
LKKVWVFEKLFRFVFIFEKKNMKIKKKELLPEPATLIWAGPLKPMLQAARLGGAAECGV